MTVRVQTFGCRLNILESAVIDGHLRAAGAADTVVVNTCAVTAEAERQARQAIRRVRREHPGARIVVTGCAAQIDPDGYAALPGVDRVVGNHAKLLAETWGQGEAAAPAEVVDIATVRETAGHLIDGFAGPHDRSRAIVEVQNGCDHRCTFCIIPQGRGPSRSVPVGQVVRQVERLVANGYREVVLSGVDLTSYGADLPGRPTLGQMVRRLLRLVPELPRLRLSSLDPAEIDADLWHLIAEEPRLMPHLHLSVQAGDDLVLKRMKRRHLRADVLAVCARARALRPGIAFGADLIAGFPTETDAMFESTVDLVGEAGLTFLHVFPYSERAGTPAARMPSVPKPVRKARAARLRDAGAAALARHLDAATGRRIGVLMEGDGAGRAEDFTPVALAGDAIPGDAIPGDAIPGDAIPGDAMPGDAMPAGTLVVAEVLGHDGARLHARPVAP
ncbi:MAG: tRNA (N(6)-L-threonylcarbamoyladenosine(37)-C(2))-methylthiotransferase MtaB [Rhodospirillaceae bacterium]|nr:tRNA (N(6)-L-threonylcarbamoyladenosine(37)-C(2))-methylthiotransferase MtaB [Rhodospirillaceae bacterium]